MDWKKILKIILFIVIAVGFGFTIYFFFFRSPGGAPSPEEVGVSGRETALGGRLPSADVGAPRRQTGPVPGTIARGGLTLAQTVVETPVSAATLPTGSASAQFYDPNDGKFYRVAPDGTKIALSDKRFFNVQTVSWSREGTQAILEYPDGSNISINFKTNAQVTLPKHWTELNFTPLANKIIGKSIGTSVESNFLIIADADGSNSRALEALGSNADRVQVSPAPGSDIIAFSRTGTAQEFGKEEVLLLGTQGQNFKSLQVDGINFEGAWSPGGRRLLGSAVGADAGYRPRLFVTEATASGVAATKLTIILNTWVDKCTMPTDDVAYCAVPQDLPDGAGLTREAVVNLPDAFYRINLITGATSFIAVPSESTSAENLLVTPDGSLLYFTDRATGVLKKIQLR